MRFHDGLFKQIAKLGMLLMLGVSMSADAGFLGFGSTSWREDVLLHDGRVIIAEQSFNLGRYTDGHNRMPLDETVTFNLPESNKSIKWKTDFRDSEPEQNSLNLILFDIVKDVPYIATYPAGCIAYNKWGRPNPPQILFKYEKEQWKRINVDEFPLELKYANIIVGMPDERIRKSFYTVDQVNEENQEIQTPEYRTILREPLAKERCQILNPSSKAPLPMKPLSTK